MAADRNLPIGPITAQLQACGSISAPRVLSECRAVKAFTSAHLRARLRPRAGDDAVSRRVTCTASLGKAARRPRLRTPRGGTAVGGVENERARAPSSDPGVWSAARHGHIRRQRSLPASGAESETLLLRRPATPALCTQPGVWVLSPLPSPPCLGGMRAGRGRGRGLGGDNQGPVPKPLTRSCWHLEVPTQPPGRRNPHRSFACGALSPQAFVCIFSPFPGFEAQCCTKVISPTGALSQLKHRPPKEPCPPAGVRAGTHTGGVGAARSATWSRRQPLPTEARRGLALTHTTQQPSQTQRPPPPVLWPPGHSHRRGSSDSRNECPPTLGAGGLRAGVRGAGPSGDSEHGGHVVAPLWVPVS